MLVSGNGFDNIKQSEESSSIKFRLGLGFTLFFFIVIIFMTAGSSVDEKPKEDNEGKENLRLSRYKKNKPKKNSHEWKDFCILKMKLEKVIDQSCLCECKNDIDSTWFNPPENGELGDEWEFISEIYSEGGSKHFRNKNTGEIVRFDKKHKQNGVDHYHRYNFEIKELIDRRKFKNENLYLDICGNVLRHNLNEKNHILVLQNSNEYKIEKNEELCNE